MMPLPTRLLHCAARGLALARHAPDAHEMMKSNERFAAAIASAFYSGGWGLKKVHVVGG